MKLTEKSTIFQISIKKEQSIADGCKAWVIKFKLSILGNTVEEDKFKLLINQELKVRRICFEEKIFGNRNRPKNCWCI